jgi:hypothetical protein
MGPLTLQNQLPLPIGPSSESPPRCLSRRLRWAPSTPPTSSRLPSSSRKASITSSKGTTQPGPGISRSAGIDSTAQASDAHEDRIALLFRSGQRGILDYLAGSGNSALAVGPVQAPDRRARWCKYKRSFCGRLTLRWSRVYSISFPKSDADPQAGAQTLSPYVTDNNLDCRRPPASRARNIREASLA